MAKYNDLPLTNFPDSEDDWTRMNDLTVNLISVALQYNELWNTGNIDAANRLLENNPDLIKTIFNADKWNKVRDAIISMERFYLNDVQTFIQNVAKSTIGINDAPTESEKITNTYSAKKIDKLTGYYSTPLTIAPSEWSSDFIYVHEDTSITADDVIEIYFNSDSYTTVSKAQVRILSDTGAGNFKLKAKKIPSDTIKIDFYKVVKKNG